MQQIPQRSKWRLLTKEEIYLLTPQQLSSYMKWIEEYKSKQLEEIQQKRTLLDKILKENLKRDENEKVKREQKDIEAVKKFLQTV